MGRMVALLRAVNVGGRKLPMAELRALCAELGWEDVATYIQSGNVVFAAGGKAAAIEAALEDAIRSVSAIDVPVIVRTAARNGRSMPARQSRSPRRRDDEPQPAACCSSRSSRPTRTPPKS